ncbi:ArsC family reductase [Burkholderiaceae bacterium DAT-1]|nr:ArsC family reductase [Burkholderiaceae bacterium DAT-1]
MITLYGIPNCDTVKKARTWLSEQQIDFVFHDFKKQGLPQDAARLWLDTLGRDVVINRQGTTWRKLTAEQQAAITSDEAALALITELPSLIKRPVLSAGELLLIGFKPEHYAQHLPALQQAATR